MVTVPKLTITQKISLEKEVLFQDLIGESALLNLETEEYFGLDETGTRMLFVLRESESIQAAYDLLLEEYEVEPEQLQKDLLDYIQELIEHGLVEVSDS
jgi:hypothetical protein